MRIEEKKGRNKEATNEESRERKIDTKEERNTAIFTSAPSEARRCGTASEERKVFVT